LLVDDRVWKAAVDIEHRRNRKLKEPASLPKTEPVGSVESKQRALVGANDRLCDISVERVEIIEVANG
jgi:hypothetical protein